MLDCSDSQLHIFTVSPSSKKCQYAYQQDKLDLQRQKRKKGIRFLKHRSHMEDFEAPKKQNLSLLRSCDALKEGPVNGTIVANKNKDII